MQPVYADVNETTETVTYPGELNVLSQEQSQMLGINQSSVNEMDPDNDFHPYENYESIEISELYIGMMNKSSSWKGSFKVMEDTDGVSSSALNLNAMDDKLLGNEVSWKNFYAENKDDKEVQTHNACAIDADGDGTDEILSVILYVDKTGSKDLSRIDIRLFDLNNSKQWVEKAKKSYDLANSKSDDPKFVDEIVTDWAKSFTALSAGDYDGDGKEEAAVYVASQVNNEPCVIVYDVDSGSFVEKSSRIYLSSLDTSDTSFSHAYDSYYMPVVSLSTTSISGNDELVVNVSQPLFDDYEKYGQQPSMTIFNYRDGKKCTYENKNMIYGSNRMRFSNAVDGDLNGDGIEELIVGGYKNNDWSGNKDMGELTGTMMLQVLTWNNSSKKYEPVWSSPKELSSRGGGLNLSEEMTEPAAMAAAKLYLSSEKDLLFLEGCIYEFNGDSLSSGSFSKQHNMAMGGSNSAFISTASSGVFSRANGNSEQIVVIAGDHRATNNDNMYFDIVWIWGDSKGNINSSVTNDDYFDLRDEDDDGTFLTLCSIDADEDSVKLRYDGKTYGWSAPVLYAVIPSAPFWQELSYNSDSYGAGEMSLSITTGVSNGTEKNFGIGGGVYGHVSAVVGVKFLGTGGMSGVGLEGELLGKYLRSYAENKTDTYTYTAKMVPGNDYAVVMAIPAVSYNYKIWIPETVITQEDVDTYNQMKNEISSVDDFNYKAGDIVAGHWEDTAVTSTFTPSFSSLTIEEYNKAVSALEKQGAANGLKPITDNVLPYKVTGDPSTYPASESDIKASGNVDDYKAEGFTITTGKGEGTQELTHEITEESTESKGFEISFNVKVFWAANGSAKIPLGGPKVEIDGELGGQFEVGGGCNTITTNSDGISFTAAIKDIPSDAPDAYKFFTKLVTYTCTDLPMGNNKVKYGVPKANAYIMNYIVTGTDFAPAKIPDNVRVFATAKDKVILKWDEPEYRTPAAYEIYVKDDKGLTQKIGTTTETYFAATNLDAGKEYTFALKAYTDYNSATGKASGTASCMSRWVSAFTDSNDVSAPKFVLEPKNAAVNVGETSPTLTSEAEFGQDVVGAALTYQWQKYSQNIYDGSGEWHDIDGANSKTYTLPEITEDNKDEFLGQNYYRVIATQTKGSNVKSVISRAATVFVGDGEHSYTYNTVNAELVFSEGEIVTVGADGITADVILTPDKENGPVPEKGKIVLIRVNDDFSEEVVGTGTLENGISIDSKLFEQEGNINLYAIYTGERNKNESKLYYPAQTTQVTLTVIESEPTITAMPYQIIRNDTMGISIEGRISEKAKLIIKKLSADDIDYTDLIKKIREGKLNHAWNIQLSMEDGSPAKWDGKLKIHIDKDKISLNSADLGVVSLNDDTLKNIELSDNGDHWTITTDTLGSFGIISYEEAVDDGVMDNENPETGDKTMMEVYILLCMLSTMTVLILSRKKRGKRS